MAEHDGLDAQVRMRILDRFIATGRAPSAGEVAIDLHVGTEDAENSYRRLAEQRRLVLFPGTTEIRMVHPFSAVPSAFAVQTGGRSYFGNCIWDSLAIIGLLGDSGSITTSCGDGCGETLGITIARGEPVNPRGIIHFQVPRAHWWDDIVFT